MKSRSIQEHLGHLGAAECGKNVLQDLSDRVNNFMPMSKARTHEVGQASENICHMLVSRLPALSLHQMPSKALETHPCHFSCQDAEIGDIEIEYIIVKDGVTSFEEASTFFYETSVGPVSGLPH